MKRELSCLGGMLTLGAVLGLAGLAHGQGTEKPRSSWFSLFQGKKTPTTSPAVREDVHRIG